MKKILITGFGPFGDIRVNPSQLIVEEILSHDFSKMSVELATDILPVIFDEAISRIQTLIREIQPDIIFSCGVAPNRKRVNLERVALNLKDTARPDNNGYAPQDEFIIPDAPLAYFSNLPLTWMREHLEGRGIPTKVSNHAGAYLCNAVFYTSAHMVNASNMNCSYGFIHIPLILDDVVGPETLTIAGLTNGICEVLEFLSKDG